MKTVSLKKIFRKNDTPGMFFLICALVTSIIVIFLVSYIFYTALPVLTKEGLGFITGTVWNYDTHQYGIFYFIMGTLILTGLTMLIACPLSIFTAIFLAEFAPQYIVKTMRPMIELLVGIPSVVYGIFGLYILNDVFQDYVNPSISAVLGFIPIFQVKSSDSGTGILLAATVLSIMILPTITVLSEESIRAIPNEYRYASYALGATRWDTIKKIVIPSAMSGILTGIVLGMMRAMGETMAIVMLLGSSAKIPSSIFDTSYAMTSKIVNEIGYYVSMDEPRAALFGIAAVLFLMEIILVGITRVIGGRKY